jgi:hypothetical protein
MADESPFATISPDLLWAAEQWCLNHPDQVAESPLLESCRTYLRRAYEWATENSDGYLDEDEFQDELTAFTGAVALGFVIGNHLICDPYIMPGPALN